MADNYSVKLSLDLDKGSISNLQNQIKNATKNQTTKIKVEIQDLGKVTSELNNIKGLINGISKNGININTTQAVNNINNLGKTAKQATDNFDKIFKLNEKINSLKFKIEGLDSSKDASRLRELTSQLKTYENELKKFKGNTTSQQKMKLNIQAREAQETLKDLKAKMEDVKRNASNQIQFKIDTKTVDSELTKIQTRLNNLKLDGASSAMGDKFQKAQAQAQTLESALVNLKSASTIEDKIREYENFEKELLKTQNVVKGLENQFQTVKKEQNLSNSKMTFTKQIEDWCNTNSKALSKFGRDIDAIKGKIENADKIQLSQLQAQFKQIDITANNLGLKGKSMFDNLKDAFAGVSQYLSVYSVLNKVFDSFKQGVEFVRELDTALTNISYTMDVTANQLESVATSSIDMADELKTSAKTVLEAVTLYANANESTKSILNKSVVAVELSNVSGMSGTDSAKLLQSVMNQFGLGEKDLERISDTLQSVSQNMAYDFSSGIQQIAEAIQLSGSVADSAGLSLEEYSAMVGKVIEKTGQSGSIVGNAYKTILLRITKASEAFGTMDEDISKAEGALRTAGVEVRATDGEFRDMGDILGDLSNVWDSLSDVQQSKISFEVAGTRQTNVFKTLMSNYEEYLNLLNSAENSEGTTVENQQKYAESLQGTFADLTNSAEAFWNGLIKSGAVKVVAKIFTTLIDGLSTITNTLGSLGSVIAGIGIVALIKNLGQVKALITLIAESGMGAMSMVTPFTAILTVAGTVIATMSAVSQAIEKAKEKSRQNVADGTDEIKNVTSLKQAYNEAESAYKNGTGSKESLNEATNQLLEALGYEEKNIDVLIEKYGTLSNAMDVLTSKKIAEAQEKALSGFKQVEEDVISSLYDNGVNEWFGKKLNRYGFEGNDQDHFSTKIFQSQIPTDKFGETHFMGNKNTGKFNVDFGKVEDIKDVYRAKRELEEIIKYAEDRVGGDTYTSQELYASDVYSSLKEQHQKMEEAISTYEQSVEDINFGEAFKKYEEYVNDNGSIETIEQFEKFNKYLEEDMGNASTKFVGSNEQIRESFTKLYGSISSLNELFKEHKVTIEDNYTDKLTTSVNKYNDALEKVHQSQTRITGNVSQTDRPVIFWDDKALETYSKELESWGAKKEDMKGSFSTLFGGQKYFEDANASILFTPIMRDENGKTVFLSEDTMNAYLEKIASSGSKKDILAKDAIGLEIELHDKDGNVIGSQYVKNVIADVAKVDNKTVDNVRENISKLNKIGVGTNADSLFANSVTNEIEKALKVDSLNLDKTDVQALHDEIYGMVFGECNASADMKKSISENLGYIMTEAKASMLSFANHSESADIYKDVIDSIVELNAEAEKYGVTWESLVEKEYINKLSEQFTELWKSWDEDAFKDVKKEIEKIAKEGDVTEDKLQELAREHEGLANAIETSGVSASNCALFLNELAKGGDLSHITKETLELNDALNKMGESFNKSTEAKNEFEKKSKEASENDYDVNFKVYEEAYKKIAELFKDGNFGKEFIENATYLLGDVSDMGIDEIYKKVLNLKKLFYESNGKDSYGQTGYGFLDKLYELSKSGKLDGMGINISQNADKGYSYSGLDNANVEKLAELYGTTSEAISACIQNLGMLGTFTQSDIGDIQKLFEDIAISADNGKTKIYSLAEAEQKLRDAGADNSTIWSVIQELNAQEGVKIFDFASTDINDIREIFGYLDKIKDVKLDDGAFDLTGLVKHLKETFKLSEEDVTKFLTKASSSYDIKYNGNKVKSSDISDEVQSAYSKDYNINTHVEKVSDYKKRLDEYAKIIDELKGKIDQLNQKKYKGTITETETKLLEDYNRQLNQVENTSDEMSAKQVSNYSKEYVRLQAVKKGLEELKYNDVTVIQGVKYDKSQFKELESEANRTKKRLENYHVDVGDLIEGEARARKKLKSLQEEYDKLSKNPIGNKKRLDTLNTEIVETQGVIDGLSATIKGLDEEDTDVSVGADVTPAETAIDNLLNRYNNKEISLKVKTSNPFTNPFGLGFGNANGTAFAYGSAFANGKDFTTGSNGKGLVGELGTEMLVRNGKSYLIGKSGAEFINYRKDDIIFNHKQTEELLKYGKVVGNNKRAKVFANGSAFVNGTLGRIGRAFASGTAYRVNTNGGSKTYHLTNNKSTKSKAKSSKKESDAFKKYIEKFFDWCETRLDRLSKKTEKYYSLAQSATDASAKMAYYQKAISGTKEQINANNRSASKYRSTANKVANKAISTGQVSKKTAKSLLKKAENGTLDVSQYSEKTRDVAEAIKNWVDKANECENTTISLTQQLKEYADAMYSIPLEKATEKVDKFSKAISVIDTRIGITDDSATLKKLYKDKEKKETESYNAMNSAYSQTKSNTSKAKNELLKQEKKAINKKAYKTNKDGTLSATKKASKADKEKIKQYNQNLKNSKQGKKLSTKGLKKDSEEYKKVVKYNSALEAQRKAYEELESATADYLASMKEIAESMARLPLDTMQKKFDKLSDKIEELDAKYEIAGSASEKNKLLDEKTKKAQEKKNATNSAINEINKSLREDKVPKALKNKKIDYKTKLSLKGVKEGSKEYKWIVKYNAKIDALNEAMHENTMATAEYTKAVQDNTLAKYENIKAEFDANRESLSAKVGKSQAYINLLKTEGKAETGKAYDNAYREAITNKKAESDILAKEIGTLSKELSTNGSKMNSEDYKAKRTELENLYTEYYNNIAERKELEAEYNTRLAKYYKNLADVMAKNIDLYQSYLKLNSARGKNVKNDKDYYENMKKENDSQKWLYEKQKQIYLEQAKQYEKGSDKYNEYFEKVRECEIALANLEATSIEYAETMKTLGAKYSALINNLYKRSATDIDNEIKMSNSLGYDTTKEQYNALISNADRQIVELKEQMKIYKSILNLFEVGSEKYDEYAQKIQDCENDINELVINQNEWNQSIFNIPINRVDKMIEKLDSICNLYSSIIKLNTAKGNNSAISDYMVQMANNIDAYHEQEKKLEAYKSLYDRVRGTDSVIQGHNADYWLEQINSVKVAMNELEIANLELERDMLDDAILGKYTKLNDSLDKSNQLLEKMDSIIKDEMLYNDDGSFTEVGLTKLAIMVKEYENAKDKVDNYNDAIQDLTKSYKNGEISENTYNTKLDELRESLADAVVDVNSFQTSLLDLFKTQMETELDYVIKLIEARSELLNKTKSYYNYAKTIKDKDKNITALKSQLSAYSGIDTQEAKAKVAQLKAELEDAERGRQDEIDNHIMELSTDALNDLKELLQDAYDNEIKDMAKNVEVIAEYVQSAKDLANGNGLDIENLFGNKSLAEILEMLGLTNGSFGSKDVSVNANEEARNRSEMINTMSTISGNAYSRQRFEELCNNNDTMFEEFRELFDYMYDMGFLTDAQRESLLKNASAMVNARGYAKGSKHIGKNQVAWTQENGSEFIIRKSDGAILTKLNQGDSVIPHNFTRNLYEWGAITPNDIINSKIVEADTSGVDDKKISVTTHYENLLNVEGNVDREVLPDLQTILEKSYEYTSKESAKQLKLAGYKPRF